MSGQTLREFAQAAAREVEPYLTDDAAERLASTIADGPLYSTFSEDVLVDRQLHDMWREDISSKLATLHAEQPALFAKAQTLEEAALAVAREDGHRIETLNELDPTQRITFARRAKASGIELRPDDFQAPAIKLPKPTPSTSDHPIQEYTKSRRRELKAKREHAQSVAKTVTNADIEAHCNMPIDKIGPERRINVARRIAAEKLAAES